MKINEKLIMNPIGAAVIGLGFIGPVHIEALRRLGHRVVGVLGSNPEQSATGAGTLGIPKGYATLDELLADANVQVVHIASPNVCHFEQCRRVLAAGKHVVCEKPLGMTSTETGELRELARKAGVVAAVNYNIRFYPLVIEARERVRAGKLGRIFHITGEYFQDWLLFPSDFNWRVVASEGGALRAVADIGTHWLDTIAFVTGLEVETIFADLQTVHPVRNRPLGGRGTFTTEFSEAWEPVTVTTEDAATILIRFRGGAKGSLNVSQVIAGKKNALRFDIAAERGSVSWNSEEPNRMEFGYRDRPNESLIRDPALLSPAVRMFANYPGGHAEGFPDSFKQLYRAIYTDIGRAVAGQSPSESALYATFADGDREARIGEAILQSHSTERWVRV